MAFTLDFEKLINYTVSDEGIALDVTLKLTSASVIIPAKIDTGSTYCIFERRFGEQLSLAIESGFLQRFGTVTGSFTAYGHSVALETAGFEFDSMVFFAEDESFTKNVLGRIGWLDKVVFGLIDYEGKIYLDRYSAE